MRNRRKRSCGIGVLLAIVAFLGAIMCLSFFSVKILLFAIAAMLIILGIFLLRL